jgi:hypothetical protein
MRLFSFFVAVLVSLWIIDLSAFDRLSAMQLCGRSDPTLSRSGTNEAFPRKNRALSGPAKALAAFDLESELLPP